MVALPGGEVIWPGLVSHSTNVVEDPAGAAGRIARFAARAGPASRQLRG